MAWVILGGLVLSLVGSIVVLIRVNRDYKRAVDRFKDLDRGVDKRAIGDWDAVERLLDDLTKLTKKLDRGV